MTRFQNDPTHPGLGAPDGPDPIAGGAERRHADPVEMVRFVPPDGRLPTASSGRFGFGVVLRPPGQAPALSIIRRDTPLPLRLRENECFLPGGSDATGGDLIGAAEVLLVSAPVDGLARNLGLAAPELSAPAATLSGRPFVSALCHGLVLEMWAAAAPQEDGALLIDAALSTLALTVLRRARIAGDGARTIDDAEEAGTDMPTLADARLQRVVAYLEENFAASLSTRDLSDVAAMSPHHFSRCFQVATGLTPHRYLMRRRIAAARDMMRRTRLDLASIAVACGFASHSHLTRTFKREMGMGPAEWRLETGSL